MSVAPRWCGQLGWPQEDQEADNPCVCGLADGHEGLHECYEGCGSLWAGGRRPEVRS
jgi:hypothetical protein